MAFCTADIGTKPTDSDPVNPVALETEKVTLGPLQAVPLSIWVMI